jgi:hypothetical protein
MKKILDANSHDLALVIGNGINRYEAPPGANSWEALLTQLARSHIDPRYTAVPNGVSLTEFYDVLDLKVREVLGSSRLQAQFCKQMSTWTHLPQHTRVTGWAKRWSIPVLTTNFEGTLGAASSAMLRRCGKDKFTAFYPWNSCYAPSDMDDPLKGFAIWHINGMQRYSQSIRLGLSHYMGSVERARRWLHQSGTRLFGANDIRAWPGAKTWLQTFLHKPLLFFGLGLQENEVFLRWLLIERAKYHQKFPSRAKRGWYVYVDGSRDINPGKELFLRGVGIELYPVSRFADIYGDDAWA